MQNGEKIPWKKHNQISHKKSFQIKSIYAFLILKFNSGGNMDREKNGIRKKFF